MPSDNGRSTHTHKKKSRRGSYLRPAHVISRATAKRGARPTTRPGGILIPSEALPPGPFSYTARTSGAEEVHHVER
jgi:hypothetical protein